MQPLRFLAHNHNSSEWTGGNDAANHNNIMADAIALRAILLSLSLSDSIYLQARDDTGTSDPVATVSLDSDDGCAPPSTAHRPPPAPPRERYV